MPESERISGYLLLSPERGVVMYMSTLDGLDETGLPWELLKEPGNLEAFRRDFLFKETELTTLTRIKIEIEKATLQRWFEIRQEAR
jgi:hypothetical protein